MGCLSGSQATRDVNLIRALDSRELYLYIDAQILGNLSATSKLVTKMTVDTGFYFEISLTWNHRYPDSCPNGHHPEWTPSRMNTIPKDTIPNGHNPEWAPSRMDTISNGHHPEWKPSRMETIPNGNHPEWTLSRMDTIPNGHHPE